MTRCLTLLAIAAITTTTFLSTLAHGVTLNVTDTDGVSHTYKYRTRCEKLAKPLTIVAANHDSSLCTLFQRDNCTKAPDTGSDDYEIDYLELHEASQAPASVAALKDMYVEVVARCELITPDICTTGTTDEYQTSTTCVFCLLCLARAPSDDQRVDEGLVEACTERSGV
ncbi:hypothetical protein DFQ27_003699 [Actinomortierella ambigua]|uniref:Secreted protein n=1 Tax=Actinomortierella ambigua TaxID=1343610 RepID=A0A9P6QL67_9FUNG|nr:hypothetical protein DFQ27_003699 [Actinomortierella ambigua]